MSEDLPEYLSHWQVADYFDSYVDQFGLRERISFRTEVVKVEPAADGYAVTLRARDAHGDPSEPEVRAYAHVVVANSHHWDPRWPEPSYPGRRPRRGAGRPAVVRRDAPADP